jgi:uncharacterized protein (UPF0332 family)
MSDAITIYLLKAEESLATAVSEYANRRHNSCANRCYYACFQAAIAALIQAGIRPSGQRWDHDYVQAQFAGVLIGRRHRYPSDLRATLDRLFALRQVADYKEEFVSEIQAARAVRRAREFVEAVQQGGTISR